MLPSAASDRAFNSPSAKTREKLCVQRETRVSGEKKSVKKNTLLLVESQAQHETHNTTLFLLTFQQLLQRCLAVSDLVNSPDATGTVIVKASLEATCSFANRNHKIKYVSCGEWSQ